MSDIKRNERDWAGQLISWLKSAIDDGLTSFEDVTNDTGIKLVSGRTKYPDILLFTDKLSGVIFNGWELKFPDTAVDDDAMLKNALEKAQHIHSDSFVTWNGSEAIIWEIDTGHYTIDTISVLKHYPKIATIQTREDLSDPKKYRTHEQQLHARALEIIHDLDVLRQNGTIKEAINISDNIIQAIKDAQSIIVPQFASAISAACNESREFRQQFNRWKIYESATLSILRSSSRKAEIVDEKSVLAKFTFYNLIGRILFYLTLRDNLPKELPPISIEPSTDLKSQLYAYFEKAGSIDYQAIFMPYFTDEIQFSDVVDITLRKLITVLSDFDFRMLPSEVIGTILENLVPKDEKVKLGQYFTSEILAGLVAFPAVHDKHSVVFDPTSGTGSFLNAFYKILKYYGNKEHGQILNQIWGNDISHFPAMLSVINLYKQDVTQTDNFPRIMRDDFFNLETGKEVRFPDPSNHGSKIPVAIPTFDGIASNFPFIQQEDIPNKSLNSLFRDKFGFGQSAFIDDGDFHINERADYFTYCILNSTLFLKDGGTLGAITSNAWLGKEYGIQFKKFLLDNFHIRYIVRSVAEHWFHDSLVSTIYLILDKGESDKPTKFVTLNVMLSDYLYDADSDRQIAKIEDFYSQIDNCEWKFNADWKRDIAFPEVYHKIDGGVDVAIIPKAALTGSLDTGVNWTQFFIATNPFAIFEPYLTQYYPSIFKVVRGERTGWNEMFVIPEKAIDDSGISSKYLIPYIKSPSELSSIEFTGKFSNRIFACQDPLSALDHKTKAWIERFKNMPNKNGSATVAEANSGHKPYWYSIMPKKAHVVTAVNPYERFFFTYSTEPFAIDQRLIAMQIQDGHDIELIASLLNSVSTFLTLELVGTARNLGALDLNANYLKRVRLLNPELLQGKDIDAIKAAFQPLKNRAIGTIFEELKKQDRINFDKVVLRSFGISESILPSMYELLCRLARTRVSMKTK
ncbi:MAG: SAM-dependent methyltransferase [Pseudoflavonifractor sp.]|nr:SAM-dependent methyltransferase [Pseudoflavonifractor sp.]